MKKSKEENPWTDYFKQMDEEKKQAEVEYLKLMKEDRDKTYLDILPKGFKDFKRSILKKQVLYYVDKATEFLNNCELYEGRVFDKKEVVRYMMRGTDYSNFYLAEMFIPWKSDMKLWMEFDDDKDRTLSKKEKGKLGDEFYEKNKEKFEIYSNLNSHLQYLKQVWKQYREREEVRNKTHEIDMEKDGFPRTGRGNICYAFIPIKGKLPKKDQAFIKLYNPRSKKDVIYSDLKYKKEDDVYSCELDGKKFFLIGYQSMGNAWSDLFSSNKEIYSGWWNKTLVLK